MILGQLCYRKCVIFSFDKETNLIMFDTIQQKDSKKTAKIGTQQFLTVNYLI